MNLTKAAQVRAGQWLYQKSGVYRVDGNTVFRGLAHIGTRDGVCVVPANKMMLVTDDGNAESIRAATDQQS
jgi:sugar lactone lactonase YvrE